MLDRLPLLAGLLALALAFGLGAVAIADSIRNRNRNDVIVVTGSAKRRIVADYVIWTASVTSQQPTAAAAADQLAGWAERVHRFLHDGGALDSEARAAPISVAAVRSRGRVAGY